MLDINQIEVLLGFPQYGDWCQLEEKRYREMINLAQAYRDKALKLMVAYWSSKNELQYEMALESLMQLHTVMVEVMVSADEQVADMLSKRATFIFDLSAAINGLVAR